MTNDKEIIYERINYIRASAIKCLFFFSHKNSRLAINTEKKPIKRPIQSITPVGHNDNIVTKFQPTFPKHYYITINNDTIIRNNDTKQKLFKYHNVHYSK